MYSDGRGQAVANRPEGDIRLRRDAPIQSSGIEHY